MRFIHKIVPAAVIAMAAFLVPVTASADTFLWKDQKHDFTMSFPDVWRIQTEDTAVTALRIAGPLAEEIPTCWMRVSDDGRIKIYPKRLADEAVMHKLDRNFWEGEVSRNGRAEIAAYHAPASLGGRGDATAVKYAFRENKIPMYGVMIGSIYGGKRYIAGCSSRYEAYERWAPLFASILGSVELEQKYHPFATGYYRDFLADPKLVLPRVKPGTLNKNSMWFDQNKYHYQEFSYN